MVEDSRPVRIGNAIRAARLARGLSQAQLAETLGVHRTTVGDWERGTSSPLLTELGPLCRALEVGPETFVEPPARPELVGRRRRRRS